ncbi:MAG: DUF2924 domain-containing protein [Xanthobacteraceae bacterium]
MARIAAMDVNQLRDAWRRERGGDPPEALSKDLIARALAHWLQEERIRHLDPHVRKLVSSLAKKNGVPVRHLKIGSVIVREYRGKLHEVFVAPNGFTWQDETYASLSVIAKKITGTSWNGPRFFGLRGEERRTQKEVQADTAPPPSKLPANVRKRSAS